MYTCPPWKCITGDFSCGSCILLGSDSDLASAPSYDFWPGCCYARSFFALLSKFVELLCELCCEALFAGSFFGSC